MKALIITSILVGGFLFTSFLYFNYDMSRAFFAERAMRATTEALTQEFRGAYDHTNVSPTGHVVEKRLVAAEDTIEIFDGVRTKVWSYNGSVPGPEIRMKLGDTLRITFTNNLPEETTIHFHGVRVPNAMDGVPGVTQDPIKPGETFVYEFTPKDPGTFWFHPHVRTAEQIERGLFGTLVVEDDTTQKYSQDVVLVIDDWRLGNDYQVDENFVTPMDLMHDGRWGNVLTVNGHLREKISAAPGERLRLRLVNTSNARVYTLRFNGLSAQAIAVDGMLVKTPFDATGFELAPGNRLDVDITIPRDAAGTSFSIEDTFTGRAVTLVTIDVRGDPVETPTFAMPTNPRIPAWRDAMKAPRDATYVLDARRSASRGMGMMGGIVWTINGKAYPNYDPIALTYDIFQKIRFQNDSRRLHPMHLHGQFFKVIARDGVPVQEDYFRDTVLVHPGETVDVALVPEDKGLWASHCHILEHADAGMMTVVSVQ